MSFRPTQLETRIQDLLEGELAEEDWPALQAELNNSEEARVIYCQYARMKSLLRQRSKGVKSLASPTPVIPIEDLMRERRRKSVGVAAFAAAAILVITLVTMRLIFMPEIQPTLTFTEVPGTLFTVTHDGGDDVPEGMVMEIGSRLQISQGTVELQFGSGVRSVIQAPADVTLHEDNTLYMNEGIAWFHVPAEAVGFQVKTHDLNVVDLGTEFGVYARPDEHDEVHVFKGKIKVTTNRLRKESATLLAGEARRIDPIGRLDTVPTRAAAFLTQLPETLPHLHWSFDEGVDGIPASGSYPGVTEIQTKTLTPVPDLKFTTTQGRFGKALKSPGRNASVTTNWPGIKGNDPRTIAYWIKLPKDEKYLHPVVGWGTRYQGISGEDACYSYIETRGADTSVGFAVGNIWFIGKTPLADEGWHHIACVYTGGSDSDGNPECYIYVNGQLDKLTMFTNESAKRDSDGNWVVDTQTNSATFPLRIFDHLVGDREASYDISPSIDELFIFQATLSQRQVKNIMLHNNYRGKK